MQLHKLASQLSLFDEKLLVNKIYFNINFLMKNRLIIAGFTPKNRLRQLKLRVFQPINKSELTHQFNFSIIKEWIMALKERECSDFILATVIIKKYKQSLYLHWSLDYLFVKSLSVSLHHLHLQDSEPLDAQLSLQSR